MTAKIIQPNPAEPQSVSVGSITLDLVEKALNNARIEMDAVLQRTAMSPGIREQKDAFPLIASADGKMIAGQFGSFVSGFLESYEGTVEEGTIFLLNDPYSSEGVASHLNDFTALLPIFHSGRLVGWSAMFGHMSDVGGSVPGSMPYGARDIFEEGLQIPPIKFVKDGEVNEDIFRLILRNSRTPLWNRCDLLGLIASVKAAGRRVCELVDRYGIDGYYSTTQELLSRNRRAMREIFQKIVPEEMVYFEDYIDDDGSGFGPFKVACGLWREGERVIFDFKGTSPQSDGSINFFLNEGMFKMFFGGLAINLFDPQMAYNDGFYDLVEVRIPDGSILKPRRPAAVSCRLPVMGRMFDVLLALLGQCAPEGICAAGFSDSPNLIYSGYDKKGEWFQLFHIGYGGTPARPRGDGFDGHALWPDFTNVPNEFLETYFPLRVEEYKSIPDSGGAGQHRGGNGISVAYRFLEPGEISIHDDRWMTSPWGVKGGSPGSRGNKQLVRADGTREWLPAKCDKVRVEVDDILYFNTWGGGGWGSPLERDPELVRLDVRRGLVSVEGARRYGVVLNDDLSIDDAATQALRAELNTQEAPCGLFNRGGSIEQVLAHCKEETHLEPPTKPNSVFARNPRDSERLGKLLHLSL